MTDMRLHVAGYRDSDAEERAELTWQLEQELRELDVDAVRRPSAEAPEGAKGSGMEWASLVVSFAGALPALVAMVRTWQSRHEGATISIEIDGDTLTLTNPSTSERAELIEDWIAEHDR